MSDERRQIEAAADRYEHMEDDEDAREGDCDSEDDDEHAAHDTSEHEHLGRVSSSSSSSNAHEEDDSHATEDGATPSHALTATTMGGDLERDVPAERLSCVSLGENSAVEPPVSILRPITHSGSGAYIASPPPPTIMTRELSAPVVSSSSICATVSSLASAVPDDASPLCCSTACREHAKWKDERIHELQRALDHMVDAMVIQQRDLAAQRAFVARQSEQYLRLSAALQQEKLALQIERERERAKRAARGGSTPTAASAAGSHSGSHSGSHPSTPSSRRATPRASASAKKLKGVLSTLAGAPPRAEQRAASPSVDARSSSWKVSSRSASESKLAPVAIPLVADPPPSRAADDSSLAEERRALAALEVRATLPEPSAVAIAKSQSAPPLSDVSLQDGPVQRVGSRSATNDASAVPAATSTGGKKVSLGERFRNLRWKPSAT